MRKLILLALVFIFSLGNINVLLAEVTGYPEIGSAVSFSSSDKKFTVEVEILGNVDKSPSECTFKEGDRIIWQKQIPATPGRVAISHNGRYLAFLNWGLYDELWFKSLYIYNDKGELLKEVEFPNYGALGLVSVKISDTGECVIKDDKDKEYKYEAGE